MQIPNRLTKGAKVANSAIPSGSSSSVVPEKRNKAPKPKSIQIKFVRLRSATADVTILASGATFNHVKLTNSTYADGTNQQVASYPFQTNGYDFARHFADRMSTPDRVNFLSKHWIEIVVVVGSNPSALLAQMYKLGPDFAHHVKNLDVKIQLPPLSQINTPLNLISASPGYKLVEEIAAEVDTYTALLKLNVVLSMPHTFARGMHDSQLSHVLPFYQVAFTKWTFKYQTPGMRFPDISPKGDLERLGQLNDKATLGNQDGQDEM
ncbi:uncharacterized protein LY89DRAFT_737059 [Mollisia scopiformis]|uniref:Uncharacterized protein n=1 Tax=Mollisia scopiformis TaxID=149040 RepID=A0A194X2J4_MOLSC|nr:uncharacterized protein LY89DRAFT_737059 [Mollisia scopiformis]KUJ14062.1 hypothetical protein LY89DRAFT_737059 [Mollisia scopiformis]